MHFTLPVLAFLGLVSASTVSLTERASGSGGVYAYTCGNCQCSASASKTGIKGSSGCISTSGSIRALGLTGQKNGDKTTCSVFTSSDCSGGVAQSLGVSSGQTWGCTALNQDIGSFQCYYAS